MHVLREVQEVVCLFALQILSEKAFGVHRCLDHMLLLLGILTKVQSQPSVVRSVRVPESMDVAPGSLHTSWKFLSDLVEVPSLVRVLLFEEV